MPSCGISMQPSHSFITSWSTPLTSLPNTTATGSCSFILNWCKGMLSCTCSIANTLYPSSFNRVTASIVVSAYFHSTVSVAPGGPFCEYRGAAAAGYSHTDKCRVIRTHRPCGTRCPHCAYCEYYRAPPHYRHFFGFLKFMNRFSVQLIHTQLTHGAKSSLKMDYFARWGIRTNK